MLNLFEKYYEELLQVIPVNYNEYVSSIEKKRACERLLQLLIEESIDICNMINKELKLGLPSEEEAIFEVLAKKEILSEDTAEKLKEMKKFRNVLVHLYAKVDDKLVYDNMQQHKDFLRFTKEIKEFVREQRKSKKK